MSVYAKDPKVALINYTRDPIATMAFFRRIMHSSVPDSIEELKNDPVKWLGMSLDDYFQDVLLKDGMPSFLESVTLLFKLENVSRALTHQIVRHRVGFVYSQQSMRCVRCEKFADEGSYHCPDTVQDRVGYHDSMSFIQDVYNSSLKHGVSTQDARGLLPMNIHTSIMFSCTLRAFVDMINKRLCDKAQGEIQNIAYQMIQLVKEKLDPRLGQYFGAPCETKGKCQMEGENYLQFKEGKIVGEQNTARVCSRYIQKFCK